MLMKFKYEKEFREAHPETTGEKDSAFDLCNYTEWLETIVSRVELPVKPANDEIDLIKKDVMALFTDINQQLAKCPYGKPRRLLLYMQEKVGNILNESENRLSV